ncbi:MAG: putative Cold shock protein 1, partial [Streblomastix strix]
MVRRKSKPGPKKKQQQKQAYPQTPNENSVWQSKFRHKICFCCRKTGHMLTDCPLRLKSLKKSAQNMGITICFNCGDAGHPLSDCPSPKVGSGAQFAICFICKAKGHLSRDCPQNTHGIYVDGGACRLCGQ